MRKKIAKLAMGCLLAVTLVVSVLPQTPTEAASPSYGDGPKCVATICPLNFDWD